MSERLTAEEARRLFRYDPKTGQLYWRARGDGRRVEDPAGCVARRGNTRYRVVRIADRLYLAHRVVWLMHTGAWPRHDTDHINGDGLDNRLENLRDVEHKTNGRNSRLGRNNTSGVNGVHWATREGRWHAEILVDGRKIHLGYFEVFEEAVAARLAANRKHGFHENHGRKRA